jgi:hypothetical protein
MKKLNLFIMFALLGFWTIVQTAQAQLTAAPDLSAQAGVSGHGTHGPGYNARIAIAPYAQVTANATYTFIGISHPSLDTAHTSIGVAVEAMDMTTVPNNAAGRAAVFTINAGETHRVFIVNQSHSTIKASNDAFNNTKTHIITTSDASQFGNIKVTGIGTSPIEATTDTRRGPGEYADGGSVVARLDNVSQLAMWGVVYKSSNGAGFALEFVGDMHDSSIMPNTSAEKGDLGTDKESTGAGRGIN